MKLYTKRGDRGLTDLFGGQRVGKDDLRVEAYGTVDELNSLVGLCLCAPAIPPDIGGPLLSVQSRLFEIGADLATPQSGESSRAEQAGAAMARVGERQIAELEGWIDAATAGTPPMTHFVMPGGTELAARLHVARTVCRRAERVVVALSRTETVGESLVIYLNRLSDLLFAWARLANQKAGVADIPWIAPKSSPEI